MSDLFIIVAEDTTNITKIEEDSSAFCGNCNSLLLERPNLKMINPKKMRSPILGTEFGEYICSKDFMNTVLHSTESLVEFDDIGKGIYRIYCKRAFERVA